MVDIEFLFYILVKFYTKSYHETNTNKKIRSYILISKFKTSIQSCKIWKKYQKSKTSYGVEAFPKNNMFFFHILQKSMVYNDPLVLPKMITLQQCYDKFKFKFKWW